MSEKAAPQPESIRIRRIAPDDVPLLQAFHRRLSPEVVHLRFHGYLRELPDNMARHFCTVDGAQRVAYVAVTGEPERIIGVGRYDRMSDDSAEVAFVVEDAYQHKGLGRLLLSRLVTDARRQGIGLLLANVLPGNTPMRKLLESTGEPIRTERDVGYDRLWLALPPDHAAVDTAGETL